MDCTFLTDEGKFNVRVCALILHEGRILLGRCEGDTSWHTVGGRLQTGETLRRGVERECCEETTVPLRTERLAALCENFFDFHGTPYHELSFYYQMEAPTDVTAIPHEFHDAGHREELRWFPVAKLDPCSVLPPFIGELLARQDNWPLHIVRHESEGTTEFGAL